jgi:hypothetical protein
VRVIAGDGVCGLFTGLLNVEVMVFAEQNPVDGGDASRVGHKGNFKYGGLSIHVTKRMVIGPSP